MKSPELPSHLKPLYARLLFIGIPSFLSTNSFKYLMIENDWDQLWDMCLEAADRLSNNAVDRLNNVNDLFANYSVYDRAALGFFIGAVGSNNSKILFSFVHKLLEIYLKSSINSSFDLDSFDLDSLRSSLITAGYQEEDVDSLLIELQSIKDSTPNIRDKIQDIDDLNSISTEIHSTEINEALEQVIQLCSRFYTVARQLRRRHDNRSTLEVADEYDVQDLLHGLLRIFFNDVRAEEYTPSYASKATRMDFLLKREQIVVEVKMTRKGLSDKEVADQLILDIERYRSHPSCKALVCFVYDPEGRIVNPGGLQADLSGDKQGLKVILSIAPNPQ